MSDETNACGRAADQNFRSGWYCAESVLMAVARHLGVESDLLPAIATGFCSGMARTCGQCGAVSGAVMGLGLALGRSDRSEGVDQSYRAIQAFLDRFRAEFGSHNCRELLDGCELGTPHGQEAFRSGQMIERCYRFTERAAGICAELIDAPSTRA